MTSPIPGIAYIHLISGVKAIIIWLVQVAEWHKTIKRAKQKKSTLRDRRLWIRFRFGEQSSNELHSGRWLAHLKREAKGNGEVEIPKP